MRPPPPSYLFSASPPLQVSLPLCPSILSRVSVRKCLLLFQALTSKLLCDEELRDMALGHDLLDRTQKTQAGGTMVNENTLCSQERVNHIRALCAESKGV